MENIYLKEYEDFYNDVEYYDLSHSIREQFVIKYSWAIPNRKSLEIIKNLNQPVVEMGAGTGYWAKLLKDNGVDIIAYDCDPPQNELSINKYDHKLKYFDIQTGNENILVNHSDRALFLCWPPYATNMAKNCLNNWKGLYLIYIGENQTGCTANDSFFEILEKEFNIILEYEIPQWRGFHDNLFIYQKKL